MAQQTENTDQIARLKCIIIEAEQAPPVPADEEEFTEENTLELAPYEVVRTMDELDAELTPWIVNEELGGP